MNLKIVKEVWGGFRTFDFICIYCFFFLFKDFINIDFKSKYRLYFFLFILLCIVTILSGLISEFPDTTYLNVLKIIPVFIFSRFFILECIKDSNFYIRAINALKISYVIALSFLLIQIIVGLKFTIYQDLNNNTVDSNYNLIRYPGIFYDSQASGQYMAMGSFLFLFVEEGISKKGRTINFLIYVFALVGIAYAGSRSAIGGFAVGMFFVFFMVGKKIRIYGIAILLILAVGYSIFSPNITIFNRAQNLSEDYLFRQSLWNKALTIAEKHPYLGIGSGNYKNYVMRHDQDQYLEIEPGVLLYFDQPENGYLKIIVELGFIGFGIFVLFILVPLFKGLLYYLKGFIDKRVIFLIAALICWLVAFNTVYSIYDNRILIMVASMTVLIITYPFKTYTYELD
ncbi:O-antigen ligase family protein [Mucilaginibacter sp.]|uniref:O-antigen ligase family protein n=1 Tax=Mucilaginibacter sp. TaxID=1882438 RepID=UPI00262BAD3F|nr:O-antigen ligase family protein [Mucilaginibacter sp.]